MAPVRPGADHARMTSSRVVLLPDPAKTPGAASPEVRRYRLARLRVAERRDLSAARHPQLLRAHD